ncbi:hypothetical protein N7451_009948 [Penicillium sp. IBT 35674x]|nr:hypothetical protein N7451_009948 [Penicillium sp. IBT 35674x]
MRTSSLLAVTLAALAAGESTTTVGYFGYNAGLGDEFGPFIFSSTAASVAGINALATTYEIKCLSDGAATYNFAASFTYTNDEITATYTETADCSFTSHSESASCSWSASITGSSSGGNLASSTSSSTSNIPTASITYWDLEVNGGVASYTAPQATKTPGAAAAPAKPLITAAPLFAVAAAAAAMF